MARGKYEKTIALATAVVCIALSVITTCGGIAVGSFGVCDTSSVTQRLFYSFFHASVLHAIINTWVFLSIVFIFVPSWKILITAYILAVLIPPCFLTTTPTVGLSVVVYILLGYVTLRTRRKLYFALWIVIYIAIGFCFGSVNAWAHVYAYLAGLTIALLNTPLRCLKS